MRKMTMMTLTSRRRWSCRWWGRPCSSGRSRRRRLPNWRHPEPNQINFYKFCYCFTSLGPKWLYPVGSFYMIIEFLSYWIFLKVKVISKASTNQKWHDIVCLNFFWTDFTLVYFLLIIMYLKKTNCLQTQKLT